MARDDKDLERIQELIQIMKDNDLTEVEIQHGEERICLKRGQSEAGHGWAPVSGAGPAAVLPVNGAAVAPGGEAEAAGMGGKAGELVEVKSPIVGTFYSQANPDSEPYVEVGSQVEPMTVVCIVEAMKVMNEIKAEVSGTISEIVVKNGQAVEYGQVLFRVRPD